MTLSRRSKFLWLGSSLAPLVIGMSRLELRHVQNKAQAEGRYGISYDPGFLVLGLEGLGIVLLIAGILSTLIDLRRTR
jgi:hypothetical protein